MPEVDAVLILGGCGFIGRNLVTLLVEKGLCGHIRVVDKVMPVMAFMAPVHKAAFDSELVEFKQGDLSRQQAVDKAFEGRAFDLVFNLTYDGIPYGQADEVYEQRIVAVSTKLGEAAVKAGVRRFIELSTAQVYEPSDKPSTEASKLKPWTKQAIFKLKAEETLVGLSRRNPGFSVVVLRTACVYGPGDMQGLSPRIICAAAYKHLNEKMRFLWDAGLRLHTVHVSDVCGAMWHVAVISKPAATYNLADCSASTQGTINTALEGIFRIQTGFAGSIASNGIKLAGLKSFSEHANEKHMVPWGEMCKAAGILNTPLTAHIDAELLAHNHLALDGTAITKTGFQYAVPHLSSETLRHQVELFIQQKLFPPIL